MFSNSQVGIFAALYIYHDEDKLVFDEMMMIHCITPNMLTGFL